MKRAARSFFFVLVALAIIHPAYAVEPQSVPTSFAGIATNATPADLVAAGFTCARSTTHGDSSGVRGDIECKDPTYRAELYGIQFMTREALFIGGVLTHIRMHSAIYPDPFTLGPSLNNRLRATFVPSQTPRLLAGLDNSRRYFWKVAPGYTLVSGKPRPANGGAIVSIGLLLPPAH